MENQIQLDKAWEDFLNLPLEAQRQAADFIAYLHQRYPKSEGRSLAKKTDIRQEPFIGMWQDRTDMEDSTAWVRNLREKQWIRKRG